MLQIFFIEESDEHSVLLAFEAGSVASVSCETSFVYIVAVFLLENDAQSP